MLNQSAILDVVTRDGGLEATRGGVLLDDHRRCLLGVRLQLHHRRRDRVRYA